MDGKTRVALELVKNVFENLAYEVDVEGEDVIAILENSLNNESMTLNYLKNKIHAGVKEKGFVDGSRTLVEQLGLVVCEIAEAIEEVRKGFGPNEVYYSGEKKLDVFGVDKYRTQKTVATAPFQGRYAFINGKETVMCNKPEGVGPEIADAIFRLLGICGEFGIDIEAIAKQKMEYNATREHKHGGKKL